VDEFYIRLSNRKYHVIPATFMTSVNRSAKILATTNTTYRLSCVLVTIIAL